MEVGMDISPANQNQVAPGFQFRNRRLSQASRYTYELSVKQYVHFLKENEQCESVDSVLKFLKAKKDVSKPSTYNLCRQALKEYLSEKYSKDPLQRQVILDLFESDAPRVKVRKSVKVNDYLKKDEIDQITQNLYKSTLKGDRRTALLIQALFWSGFRASELCSIRKSDVFVGDVVHVQVVGKGAKEYKTYLPLELYRLVVLEFDGREFLFETRSGRPYNRRVLSKEIQKKCLLFGYHATAHTFRHSKAMFLKDEMGLSPDKIAKAMNHSNVKTVLDYYFHGEPEPKDLGILDGFSFK
jgi:integrase